MASEKVLFLSELADLEVVVRNGDYEFMPNGSMRPAHGRSVKFFNGTLELAGDDREAIEAMRRSDSFRNGVVHEPEAKHAAEEKTDEMEVLKRRLAELEAQLAQKTEEPKGLARLHALKAKANELGIRIPRDAKADEIEALIIEVGAQ